jgi:hypothetical protein
MSDIFIKNSGQGTAGWRKASKIFVKTAGAGSTGWKSAIGVWIKNATQWLRVWPLSGIFATRVPYIAKLSEDIYEDRMPNATYPVVRIGTSYFGKNARWDLNGWLASSYTYRWKLYTEFDSEISTLESGTGSGWNSTTGEDQLPSSIWTVTNSTNADRQFLGFEVVANNSSNSQYNGLSVSTKIKIVRNKPRIATGGTPSFNITSPKVGDTINYSSSWDTTEPYRPEPLRSTIIWYKNSTATTTGGEQVQFGGYSYIVKETDASKYIYAVETNYNSGTDYELGIATGVSVTAITSSAVASAPVAPTSLTATSNRGDGVFLQWNAVPGANYYEIYWQSSQGTGPVNQSTFSDFGQNNSITTNSFLDTTITPGTTRYYRVRARSESVSTGANCSNWFPAPASNAIAGFRVKPGAITTPTAYSFSTQTANGYFTTGTNTNSVQYKLQGLSIPISSQVFYLSTTSSYPYKVSVNVASLFNERVWNMDTYIPGTTYYANTSVWYAGNQYTSKLQSFSGQTPPSSIYWTASQLFANPWSSSANYAVGAKIWQSGNIYTANASNTGSPPGSTYTLGGTVFPYWSLTQSFPNTYSQFVSYSLGQTVDYNGTRYTAKDPGFSGVTPPNSLYWSSTQLYTYYPGEYVSFNGTRYYVKQITSGTYPNNTTFWNSGLGLWRYEFTPYFDTGAGDVAYSSSTRDLFLSHVAAGDPMTLGSAITFSNITASSFTSNYQTGSYANYAYIDVYKVSPFTRLGGYQKIRSVVPFTLYTDTPSGTPGVEANTDYQVSVTPRYYYSFSPDIYDEGTGDSKTVKTLLPNPTAPTISTVSSGYTGDAVSVSFTGGSGPYYQMYWTSSSTAPTGNTNPDAFGTSSPLVDSSGPSTTGTYYMYVRSTKTDSYTGIDPTLASPWSAGKQFIIPNRPGVAFSYGTATSQSGGWTASINAGTQTGASYSIVNYTAGNPPTISAAGVVTASGLTSGQTSSVTVKKSVSGYNDITATASGSANVIVTSTLSYNANGGSVTPPSLTMASGTAVNLAANAGTRAGFSFGGWNIGGTTYVGSQIYFFTASDAVATAIWNVVFVTPSAGPPNVSNNQLGFVRSGTSVTWYSDYPPVSGSVSYIIGMEWQIRTTNSTTTTPLNTGTYASGGSGVGSQGNRTSYISYPGAGTYPYAAAGNIWGFRIRSTENTAATSSARFARARVIMMGTNGTVYFGTWSTNI